MAHARVVALEPEHLGERRHHRRAILGTDPERLQARREPAPRDLDGIAVRHPVGVAQERGDRPVGLLAKRRARRAPDRGALEAPGRLEPREELPLQPRLPSPGLADEAQHLATPRPHVVEDRFHPAKLALAPDQGRGQPEALEAAGRARGRQRAQEAMDPHWLALALERDLLARGERERVMSELIRRVADQDLTRRRSALQARGGVDGVAGHRVGGVGGRANPACHDRAGVDPDVQRERPPHPPRPAEIERAHPLAHHEGGAQPALGIVLVRARGAEDRHDRVTHEFLDEALVALDRPGHLAEQIALDGAHVLGVELFAERGEPGQVCEEHGDRAAVALGLGRRGRRRRRGSGGEPRSTLGAEREVGGRLEAAPATAHDARHALRRRAGRSGASSRRHVRSALPIVSQITAVTLSTFLYRFLVPLRGRRSQAPRRDGRNHPAENASSVRPAEWHAAPRSAAGQRDDATNHARLRQEGHEAIDGSSRLVCTERAII